MYLRSIIISVLIFFSSIFLNCQQVNKDIIIYHFKDNIYQYTAFYNDSTWGRIPSNGLIVIDSSVALLIDTPWNDVLTSQLYQWLQDSMNVRITKVIATHSHNDRMGGLGFLNSRNIISYSHELTKETAIKDKLPVPMETFQDSMRLIFGKTELILKYLGEGHTKDNIVVWLPQTQILFGGCMVKSAKSKDLGNTTDANIKEWQRTIIKAITQFRTAKIIIPGHGISGGPELLEKTLSLIRQNHFRN